MNNLDKYYAIRTIGGDGSDLVLRDLCMETEMAYASPNYSAVIVEFTPYYGVNSQSVSTTRTVEGARLRTRSETQSGIDMITYRTRSLSSHRSGSCESSSSDYRSSYKTYDLSDTKKWL